MFGDVSVLDIKSSHLTSPTQIPPALSWSKEPDLPEPSASAAHAGGVPGLSGAGREASGVGIAALSVARGKRGVRRSVSQASLPGCVILSSFCCMAAMWMFMETPKMGKNVNYFEWRLTDSSMPQQE